MDMTVAERLWIVAMTMLLIIAIGGWFWSGYQLYVLWFWSGWPFYLWAFLSVLGLMYLSTYLPPAFGCAFGPVPSGPPPMPPQTP